MQTAPVTALESAPPAPKPKRVVLIDDSLPYAELWRTILATRYGERVVFEHYQDPLRAIPHLSPDIDLLLLDLELPVLDGRKMVALATERGLDARRIVILSARDADDLHRLFPQRTCLAVINKIESRQQQAFLMILDSVMKR